MHARQKNGDGVTDEIHSGLAKRKRGRILFASMPAFPMSGAKAPAVPPFRQAYFRWVICGLLFLVTVNNYMDRQILGLLKPDLMARPEARRHLDGLHGGARERVNDSRRGTIDADGIGAIAPEDQPHDPAGR